MKRAIATKQKPTATRAVKTSETVRLRSGLLPVYRVSVKSLIDPSEFIPITHGEKPAGKGINLLRRADLFPNKAFLHHAPGHFGDTLLDVFSPRYGSFYPLGNPYFEFDFSRLFNTNAYYWYMELNKDAFDYEPVLQFRINPHGSANYVNIPLGVTKDFLTDRCIMTVHINNTEFNLNLFNRSNQNFDIVLAGDSFGLYDVKLALRHAPNSQKRTLCVLKQVELYNTIRAFPVGAFEA